ncbi:hypothetical protein [Companilactobacillus halodurans]|uniref:Cell surface protein n=1 Tax=Companilactobacillus halodurans TaxID=2584183 RepID=A0A5P0ZU37_9LACO|nr:hypothetical protein [Companilactobacillus halodurans]MQS76274.1 hypothetical protein [Companilactobacillus halodurans]MQS96596.1 hypothetical protein [Companilactobacillus halodurans]
MRKKILVSLLLIISSLLLFISFNTNLASADLTDSTDLAVLKDAPKGIGINKYFSNSAPKVYDKKDIYDTNSAQIVDNTGANSDSGNIISLANSNNTYGSMWSNDKTFDINKEQTISAWMYFGSGDGESDINSEGIAFVLQNDDNGVAALGAGLEGLGVYGYDASEVTLVSGTNAKQSYIKNTAVQNSVALEFDTEKNNFYDTSNKPINNNGKSFPSLYTYYSLNGYDTQLGTATSNLVNLGFPSDARYGAGGSYGHIALTYPGLADSYQPADLTANSTMKNQFVPFDTGYDLVHIKPTAAYLINDTDSSGNPIYWHHVTIKWIPAESGSTTAKLEYSYNDKSTDGSDNNNTTSTNFQRINDTIDVDTTKLNTTDGKVRWGFTAANGSSTSVATKLVAFDSIPELLYGDADASITDNTLNKTITSDSTDKKVAGGDSLSLNYDLNYIRGNENWKDIAAQIKIPDNVTVTPDANGNVAYITYNDANKTTEAISSSELVDGSLKHTLAKTIGNSSGATGTSATIKISATANQVNSDTNVGTKPATFTGSNNIATTNSPAFTIMAPKKYSLKLDNTGSSNLNLLYKADNSALNLVTDLTYSDNHSFGDDTTGTNIIYQITAGDKTYTAGATATDDDYNQSIDLKSLIDNDTDFWNIFTENSTQTVTIKAIDQANGLVSNTVTYIVDTKPNKSLSMTVSKNLNFKDINLGDTTEYLKRNSDFDLSVTSLREPWQLNVSTNGLYLNGKTLDSNLALVYRKTADSNYAAIGSTPTMIDEDTTSHETSSTEDIADDWTNNSGLLLKQLGASNAGKYTGTLTWTVSDSVSN